jgi:hypothetical protein
MSDMSDLRPKRVLSEAQRLAFLKGREKRMANLEKKRLEKQEAAMASQDFELPPAPAEPKKPRKSRTKKISSDPGTLSPATVITIDSEPVIEPKQEPEPEPETRPEPEPQSKGALPNIPPFDEDKFAEKVVAKLKDSMSMPPPPPKLVTRRRKTTPGAKVTKAVRVPDQEDAIPPYNNFSWL